MQLELKGKEMLRCDALTVVALAWVRWVRPNPSIFRDGFAEPINFMGCSKKNTAYTKRENFIEQYMV